MIFYNDPTEQMIAGGGNVSFQHQALKKSYRVFLSAACIQNPESHKKYIMDCGLA